MNSIFEYEDIRNRPGVREALEVLERVWTDLGEVTAERTARLFIRRITEHAHCGM